MMFNRAEVMVSSKTILNDPEHKIPEDMINPSLALVLVTCDLFNFFMFTIKFILGARWAYNVSNPPKKDYEFVHKGKMGHVMWRVQRVKIIRARLLSYFYMSTITIIFGLGQGAVVDVCFFFFGSD